MGWRQARCVQVAFGAAPLWGPGGRVPAPLGVCRRPAGGDQQRPARCQQPPQARSPGVGCRACCRLRQHAVLSSSLQVQSACRGGLRRAFAGRWSLIAARGKSHGATVCRLEHWLEVRSNHPSQIGRRSWQVGGEVARLLRGEQHSGRSGTRPNSQLLPRSRSPTAPAMQRALLPLARHLATNPPLAPQGCVAALSSLLPFQELLQQRHQWTHSTVPHAPSLPAAAHPPARWERHAAQLQQRRCGERPTVCAVCAAWRRSGGVGRAPGTEEREWVVCSVRRTGGAWLPLMACVLSQAHGRCAAARTCRTLAGPADFDLISVEVGLARIDG